jgi:hypothetical protein
MNKIKYTTAVLTAISGLALSQAKAADTFSSDLTVGNDALSGYSGPFANVLVTLTSATTATVTFTSLTNSGNIYLFGDGGSVAVNVNATSFTLDNITGSNAGAGFSPGPFTSAGSGTSDGHGTFNGEVDTFGGFTHSSDTVSFDLTNTSGTWASAASVLTPNSLGFDAAAHIFVTSSPADASNGAIVTGFAAEVPEPSATLLVPIGAILGFVLRFRLKR